MELQFQIKKIKPNVPLAQKLKKLGEEPEIHRIIGKIEFIKADTSSTVPIDAIIDTGAIFSLFPGTILNEFPKIRFERHTLWGIIDAPECQIKTKVASIPLRLIGNFGNRSPMLNVLGAFSEITDIPALLGMKNLLERYSYNYNSHKGIFTIEF